MSAHGHPSAGVLALATLLGMTMATGGSRTQTARAGAPAFDASEELTRGTAALRAKRYDEAIQRLRRVALKGKGDLRRRAQSGLGLAYGETGVLTASTYWWRTFLASTHSRGEVWKPAREVAQRHLQRHNQALLNTHGTLAITIKPSDGVFTIRPRPTWLPPSGVPSTLLAGTYVMEVSKTGHVTQTRTLQVSPGRTSALTIELPALPPTALDGLTPPTSSPPAADAPSPWLVGGAVAVGVGSVLLIGAGMTTGLAASDHSELVGLSDKGAVTTAELARFDRLAERLNARVDTSIGLYIAGGVIAATGIGLLIYDTFDPVPQTSWRLDSGPGELGMSVKATW